MPRTLARAAAVILLLLVCVDLGIPSLCAAESIPVPPLSADDSQPLSPSSGGPNSPVLGEGDCFCCCAHIVPQSVVLVVANLTRLAGEPPVMVHPVLLPIPQLIFHPPKA